MKKDKKIAKTARQIMNLEKEMYFNDDVDFYLNKINKIKSLLTEQEINLVEKYIMEQEKN